MRISDWSSDVCSSDLLGVAAFLGPPAVVVLIWDSGAIAGLLPVLGLFVAQSLLLLVFAWLAVLRPHRLRLADIGLRPARSEEHTSELQSLMRISYAVFCLKKKKNT